MRRREIGGRRMSLDLLDRARRRDLARSATSTCWSNNAGIAESAALDRTTDELWTVSSSSTSPRRSA